MMETNLQNIKLNIVSRKEIKETFHRVNWTLKGKVCDVVGNVIEARMPGLKLGTIVNIALGRENDNILAEVVGFKDEKVLLLPYSELNGIGPGSTISRHSIIDQIPVGDYLLGKVLDPFLNPLSNDEVNIPEHPHMMPINADAPNPMARERITKTLSSGVRAIDGLLTIGEGQRMGVMAGSGVGKSVLLGMIARGSSSDINVIGLIGERGREVREFIEKDLGPEGLAKSVVIAVTSDQSPLMKIRAAKAVHSIAEYFSQQGKSVMLMLDSLTRVAMAQREIGLSVGEPPTTKGYTPSVFSLLPRLLERSGPQLPGHGAISGIYSVLVDGDDFNDPISDAARSILDGQVNLSRRLASKGHFPAIDVTTSISRVMPDIINNKHRQFAMLLKELIGTYEENVDLIQIGAYQSGSNATLDFAIQMMPVIESYLKQDLAELSDFDEAIEKLEGMLSIPESDQGQQLNTV